MGRCPGCPCEGMEFECPAIARPAVALCNPAKRAQYAGTLIEACLNEQHPLGTDRTNGRRWDDGPAPQLSTVDSPTTAWPRLEAGTKVRVGIAFPLLWLGGVELWAVALARLLDPARIAWVGVAVEQERPCDAMAMARLEEFGPVRAGAGQIEALARACDVLIVWGTDVPPRPRPCKVLLVSHGQGEWTRLRMQQAPLADRLAAVSVAARLAFPEEYRDRVEVIPNGLDRERLRPREARSARRRAWGLGESERVALLVARLSAEKRPDAFFRAVAALPPGWTGVVVGRGLEDAEAYYRALGHRIAPGRLVFAGPTDDVGSAYAAADVGVIPSEQEGCCLVMLEMLLAGLPVVATPVGHALELDGLITLTAPMADGPELAAAILATFDDPWIGGRIVRARRRVEAVHGPEAFGRAWSDLICEMDRIPGVADVGDGVYVTDLEHCPDVVGRFDLSIHIRRPNSLLDTCPTARSSSTTHPGQCVEYLENNPLATMRPGVEEIAAYLRRPGRLLIHCQSGQCRAPTLAMLARIVRGADPEAVPGEVRAANLDQRGVQTDLLAEVIADIRAWGEKLCPAAIRERQRRLAKARTCPDRRSGRWGCSKIRCERFDRVQHVDECLACAYTAD